MKIWLDGGGPQIPAQGLLDSAELPLGPWPVLEWREPTVPLWAVPPAKKSGLGKLVFVSTSFSPSLSFSFPPQRSFSKPQSLSGQFITGSAEPGIVATQHILGLRQMSNESMLKNECTQHPPPGK